MQHPESQGPEEQCVGDDEAVGQSERQLQVAQHAQQAVGEVVAVDECQAVEDEHDGGGQSVVSLHQQGQTEDGAGQQRHGEVEHRAAHVGVEADGNIFSLVERLKPVTLQEIASIMKDVISAVYYLHHMNPKIIHRDIKPENVLLDQGKRAKLTDFGWSNYMEVGTKRTTVCGTPIYLAPEIINNRGHDERVDIWCIGVLLFELIVGRPPFSGETEQQVKYNIMKMKINWPNNIDRDAADLISKILRGNPDQRISLEQMLQHQFFTKFFPNAISSLKKPDNSIKYKTFIVSKDNPLTWNPIDIPGTSPTTNSYGQLNQYNYDNLYQKYENLKQEYNEFRNEGYTSSTLDSLRRELKEKENTINQLVTQQNNKKIYQSQNYATVYSYQNPNQGNNNFNIDNYGNIVNLGNTGYDYKTNNELRMTYNYLVNENYDLKNKLNK